MAVPRKRHEHITEAEQDDGDNVRTHLTFSGSEFCIQWTD